MGTIRKQNKGDIMKIEAISPNWLSFISGVCAAVSINILTSFITSSDHNYPIWKYYLAAIPWLIIAFVTSYSALIIAQANREADISITENLSQKEKLEILTNAINPIRRRIKVCIVLSISLIIIAVLTIDILFY